MMRKIVIIVLFAFMVIIEGDKNSRADNRISNKQRRRRNNLNVIQSGSKDLFREIRQSAMANKARQKRLLSYGEENGRDEKTISDAKTTAIKFGNDSPAINGYQNLENKSKRRSRLITQSDDNSFTLHNEDTADYLEDDNRLLPNLNEHKNHLANSRRDRSSNWEMISDHEVDIRPGRDHREKENGNDDLDPVANSAREDLDPERHEDPEQEEEDIEPAYPRHLHRQHNHRPHPHYKYAEVGPESKDHEVVTRFWHPIKNFFVKKIPALCRLYKHHEKGVESILMYFLNIGSKPIHSSIMEYCTRKIEEDDQREAGENKEENKPKTVFGRLFNWLSRKLGFSAEKKEVVHVTTTEPPTLNYEKEEVMLIQPKVVNLILSPSAELSVHKAIHDKIELEAHEESLESLGLNPKVLNEDSNENHHINLEENLDTGAFGPTNTERLEAKLMEEEKYIKDLDENLREQINENIREDLEEVAQDESEDKYHDKEELPNRGFQEEITHHKEVDEVDEGLAKEEERKGEEVHETLAHEEEQKLDELLHEIPPEDLATSKSKEMDEAIREEIWGGVANHFKEFSKNDRKKIEKFEKEIEILKKRPSFNEISKSRHYLRKRKRNSEQPCIGEGCEVNRVLSFVENVPSTDVDTPNDLDELVELIGGFKKTRKRSYEKPRRALMSEREARENDGSTGNEGKYYKYERAREKERATDEDDKKYYNFLEKFTMPQSESDKYEEAADMSSIENLVAAEQDIEFQASKPHHHSVSNSHSTLAKFEGYIILHKYIFTTLAIFVLAIICFFLCWRKCSPHFGLHIFNLSSLGKWRGRSDEDSDDDDDDVGRQYINVVVENQSESDYVEETGSASPRRLTTKGKKVTRSESLARDRKSKSIGKYQGSSDGSLPAEPKPKLSRKGIFY